MKFKTLQTLTQDVLYEISQVPGVSVQTYGEPVIQRKLQHHFDMVFNEAWWPQFYTRDYTVYYSSWTGLPVNDFSSSPVIRGLEDIRWIYRPGHTKPLNKLPAHLDTSELSGTTARFYDSYPTEAKLFRIYPIPDEAQSAAEVTNTHYVRISYRTRPDDYATNATVRFDSLYLLYAVCHDILTTDADNPGDVEKYRILMQTRLDQLKGDLASTLPTGHQNTSIPNEWTMV